MTEHNDRRGLAVFDLDGTLFRADAATVPAARMAFREHDLPVPPDEQIRHFIGIPPPQFHAWIRSVCPPGVGEKVAESLDRHEIELVLESGRLYDGVREALDEIRTAVARMAICTNGPHDYVHTVLESQGLTDYFDAVRHLESDDDQKTAMVAEVLARFGGPGVVVGDRHHDIEAAHVNGLPGIGVTYGMGSAEDLAGADALTDDPARLPALVVRLLNR